MKNLPTSADAVDARVERLLESRGQSSRINVPLRFDQESAFQDREHHLLNEEGNAIRYVDENILDLGNEISPNREFANKIPAVSLVQRFENEDVRIKGFEPG